MSTHTQFDREIDVRHLSCPLPIFSTRKSVDNIGQGEIVKIRATDKGAVNYFKSLARQTGLVQLAWEEQGGEYQLFITKG